MNQKCFLCNDDGAKIIDRLNGYDGKYIICPKCNHYRISRNGEKKIIHGHKAPISLSNKVKSHFEETGEPFEINTITLSLF
jgi:hypothetical protein